jgi:glycosyltransferase involved in cell wall biosynthesis
MRNLADGVILYTYTQQEMLASEDPSIPSWVAANSLYPREFIAPAGGSGSRNTVMYVGRLAPAKKVDLLVRGFALAKQKVPHLRLRLVGDGTERQALVDLIEELGLSESVELTGWVSSASQLADLYRDTICTTSTGFAGLGLTQSLGFGVPQVVARGEAHSPEIELADTGGVMWFEKDSPQDLSRCIVELSKRPDTVPDPSLSQAVRQRYSAEVMAAGLHCALTGATA